MRIYYEDLLDGEKEEGDFINVCGGEYVFDDNYNLAEYGIQIGDLFISEMTPEEYKRLAIAMVNHLGVNGHRFELGFHQDGQYIKEK